MSHILKLGVNNPTKIERVIIMILIGFMHHTKNPQKVEKALYVARAAKAQGADFVYFGTDDVDLKAQTINGYILVNDSWVRALTRFPHVIINAGSPLKFDDYIVNSLKENIPFTSIPTGNKLEVYSRIKRSGKFISYLIPTETVKKVEDVKNFLLRYHQGILKPINGHKGENILFIERKGSHYIVNDKGDIEAYNEKSFDSYLKKKLLKRKYLIQLYICSKTKDGYAYDVRLHMIKNKDGEWQTPILFPRISTTDSVITNCSSGGKYIEPSEFFSKNFTTKRYQIKRELEEFGINLSNHLDKLQIQQKKQPFDELGIDIGIDEKNLFWIYEVNWRPGFIYPVGNEESFIAQNLVGYAISLIKS
jgi:UDP-N-acetylmuramoyl-tripeptide--D-alanyl-D-alanine ligase